MGVCINIFGIPILEDKECADARREDREDRKKIKADKSVAKSGEHTERVESRQEGHTDRTTVRQEGHTDRTTARAENNYQPATNALNSIFGGLSGLTAGLGSGLTSGLIGPIGQAVVPIAAVAAGGGILYYAVSRSRSK